MTQGSSTVTRENRGNTYSQIKFVSSVSALDSGIASDFNQLKRRDHTLLTSICNGTSEALNKSGASIDNSTFVTESRRSQRLDLKSTPRLFQAHETGFCSGLQLKDRLHYKIWSSYGLYTPENYAEPAPARPGDELISLEFSEDAERLLAGSERGSLRIHSTSQLFEDGVSPARSGELAVNQNSLPEVDVPARLICGKWVTSKPGWIAILHSCGDSVRLCNLNQSSLEAGSLLTPRAYGPDSRSALRLNDLVFLGKGGHTLAASGTSAQTFLWDTRGGRYPQSVIPSEKAGPIKQLQAAPDGYTLLAAKTANQPGRNGAEVQIWDIRKTSSVANFGAKGPSFHTMVAAVSLRGALENVAKLTKETSIPLLSLENMLLDPLHPTCIAFSLSCGWSGLIDLVKQQISHLFCPEATSWLRKIPCWSADGSTFCIPNDRRQLHALDFTQRATSHCSVEGRHELSSDQIQAAVTIEIDGPISVIASHPHSDNLLTGWDKTLRLICPGQQHANV